MTNVWIPDGYKDTPVDRSLRGSCLPTHWTTYSAEALDPHHNLDAVEGKLFGIGSESYVVGSHEFYLGYAITREVSCSASTAVISIPPRPSPTSSRPSCSTCRELLLHVSRGVRWDSDHVVVLNDDLMAIMQELVRGRFLDRTHIGLDYFDASINRVAAWAIGCRNALRALLMALLEPIEQLRALEQDGDHTARLATLEALKGLPFGAVWDYFCHAAGCSG